VIRAAAFVFVGLMAGIGVVATAYVVTALIDGGLL
jgi:hypothetical protein